MGSNTFAAPETFPFRVLLGPEPLFSTGGDVRLTASLADACDSAALQQVDGVVDAFWMIASSGGLSGHAIAPEHSQIAEKSDVTVQDRTLTWDLLGCRIDERALLNLLNVFRFIHGWTPLAAIDVGRPDTPARRTLALTHRADDYYPRMYEPPFRVAVDQPIGASLSVVAHLVNMPTESQVEAIEEELLSWSVAPSIGAFAVPGVDIQVTGMEPDHSIDVFDNEIQWSMHRVRLHPAAIDSLVNCCTAVSERVARIAAISIT